MVPREPGRPVGQVRGILVEHAGLPPKIASKIMPITVTGCWEWIGARDSWGYGNVKVGRRMRKAHRVIYELVRGPVAPELDCDHLCRVPWCVNPEHIEVVSHVENVRRGAARWVPGARQRAKRRCPRGHAYTKVNTYVQPSTGGRACRTCGREKKRAWSRASQEKGIPLAPAVSTYAAIRSAAWRKSPSLTML